MGSASRMRPASEAFTCGTAVLTMSQATPCTSRPYSSSVPKSAAPAMASDSPSSHAAASRQGAAAAHSTAMLTAGCVACGGVCPFLMKTTHSA